PWVNFLMNDEFFSMISNTGGGLAYYKDPSVYRLLRYRYYNVPYDRPGRYIYIKDHKSGKYWSGTWAPVMTKGGEYKCRVGMAYQIICCIYNSIKTEITYFIPSDRRLEIWDLKVTNLSKKPRSISTFSYAEFAFWGAIRDDDLDNCPNISRQKFKNGAILHFSYNDLGTRMDDMEFEMYYGFHTSNTKPAGFNGDRDKFIGNYRDERNPLVVEKGKSTNYCKGSGYPIGCLEHKLNLKPGETKRVVYQTGFAWDEKESNKISKKYKSTQAVDRAFAELKKDWRNRFDMFNVKTPDRNFNAEVNSFVQYQAAVNLITFRPVATWRTGGSGTVMGFRNSTQDQLGMMHAFPDKSREMIIRILGAMHNNGAASHSFNPFSKQLGHIGVYDDHNWIALAVTDYLKHTGDMAFLDKKVAYCNNGNKGTVLEHLLKAQDYAWRMRGAHGLMQTGLADWNDSLNPGDKRSESVFTTLLYAASTRVLIELLQFLNKKTLKAKLEKRYREIRKITNKIAWDGRWYKRLFKTDGEILGSKSTKREGTIFLEPQPWSIISGVATDEKAKLALEWAEKKLATPHGHKVMDRPSTVYDKSIGSVGIYLPGIKENGAVFSHASSWMIYAEALLGRGDRAMKYYRRMAFTTKNRISDLYEVEPYASCQFVAAKPFHIPGRGRNSWNTGTSPWLALATMQGIIGCRPDYDGLIMNPSIPEKWAGFDLTRVFRGIKYDIKVINRQRISHGVKEIAVNGKIIKGCKIPFDASDIGKTVRVQVVMGN
ncbi:MAG: hypothetical protein ABIA63_13565, partial [bacterium]